MAIVLGILVIGIAINMIIYENGNGNVHGTKTKQVVVLDNGKTNCSISLSP